MELTEREKNALAGTVETLRGLALNARRENCGYAWLARQRFDAQEEDFPAEMLEAFGRLFEGDLVVGVRYLSRVLDLDTGQYMPTMAQANALHEDIMRYRDAHPDADPEEIIEYNRARFDELRERIRAEGLMSGIQESVTISGTPQKPDAARG